MAGQAANDLARLGKKSHWTACRIGHIDGDLFGPRIDLDPPTGDRA